MTQIEDENMEVEVTINVDRQSYESFCNSMKSSLVDIYDQWNIFFDTTDKSLSKSKKRCRVRSIETMNHQFQYTICAKSAASDAISGSIARRREIELDIPEERFNDIIHHPDRYYTLAPEPIQKELNEFSDKTFCFMVDFRSIRRIYQLDEFKVESDECFLPDGTIFYQLEVESHNPEKAKSALVDKLNELNLNFTEATTGKYTTLVSIPADKRFSSQLQQLISNS